MASAKFNAKSPTIKRILREAAELSQSPSPDFYAAPASDSDLFDWHFTLRGPPSSAFASGIYHGRIVLPPTYPLRPPSFRFLTPSGRFEVNREICLSISGHHEETWMPAWGVRTALTALRSFMETDAKGQLGGMDCSKAERERFAGDSVKFKCSICQKSNAEILEESKEAAEAMGGDVKEETVPEELKMAYKDELAGKEKNSEPGREQGTGSGSGQTEAELAEAFVQTGPLVTEPERRSPPIVSSQLPARPGQTVPQPTATIRQPPPTVAAVHQQAQMVRTSNDGVPIWIDRAIAAIVVCLIALVLKVLLGL